MTKAARYSIYLLLLAMGINHFVLGIMWLPTYRHSAPVVLAFALYILALLQSIFGHQGLRISKVQSYLNLAIAAIVPALVLIELPRSQYAESGSYQTWFVAAVSLVLAITSGRGYPVIGWVGTAIMFVEVVVWGGPAVITTTGLVGALTLVLAGWGLGAGLKSTEEAAADFYRKAAELNTRTAQAVASRNARQRMRQTLLLNAQPLLERIVSTNGNLDDADRTEAVLLELRLRDEIQGVRLLDDGVRLATRLARQRGVEVTFNDEGGMNRFGDDEKESIRRSIAQAIDGTAAGKIYIHAPASESFAVSIIASRPEAAAPDLWLRLP